MHRWNSAGRVAVAVGLAVLAAGCGKGGPRLATVTGTVSLDGKPLANAKVEFQPLEGGSPSYGTTDSNGHYRLMFSADRPGAMIGKHVVRITTFRQESKSGEPPVTFPELVPPRYNVNSELTCEVKPGHNTFDFSLHSAGKPANR